MKLAWKKRKHIKARIRCVISFFIFFQANPFFFRSLLTVNKYYQCFQFCVPVILFTRGVPVQCWPPKAGGTHPTGMLSCVFTLPRRSRGKVMFLHLSVILFKEEGMWVSARHPPGRHPPRQGRPLQRTVCILVLRTSFTTNERYFYCIFVIGLSSACNEFGLNEHPVTTSNFICILSLIASGTQCDMWRDHVPWLCT